MKFEAINAIVNDVPFISTKKARILYDFLIQTRANQCLELGHGHGASSCYIAAAIDELGIGRLTTVDLLNSRFREPNIEHLLSLAGLEKYVDIQREVNSYTWFLKKKIEYLTKDYICEPMYDFCYIDGPKNWTVDGLAFFLVDKLLRPGGWILFDDYSWTYGWSEQSETDGISNRQLGVDELNQAHIERIFQLLVMQHPSYSEFKIQDEDWAWAHKVSSPSKTTSMYTTYTLVDIVKLTARRIGRKLYHAALG
jgi:predicted O-methyltransferase YrrM